MKNFKIQFGGKITPEMEARYNQSPNWIKGKFRNIQKTSLSIKLWEIPVIIYKQLTNKSEREPTTALPIMPFDKENFLSDQEGFKFTWYGHSALLMRMNSKTILIDPMFGSNTTPISPFKTRRFSENTLELIDDFPDIDLVVISHDHYDHLDFDSIQKLKHKTNQFYVALGVKRHLVKWGVDENIITEFDWWDHIDFYGIGITYTPSRHFSGRGMSDRSKSLWGGWAFQSNTHNIWFSGDGGYGDHFKEIGRKLGPFDFGFMECGQYNDRWHQIHMFPEESVQAALDANVKYAMPVHWGGFSLSLHSWTTPAELFSKFALTMGLKTNFPELGQIATLENIYDRKWWKL
jgi:L-ascorbate metabolism protein UlaG (beta-lactamase superfamily)